MDYFLFYLILRLDVLSEISRIFAITTGILFVMTLLISALNFDKEEAKKAVKPWAINFGIIFAITLFLTVMIPNTKQAAAIYCLPKIINNEQVQKMPDNLLRLANQWIDNQIIETAETVIESVEN